MGIRVTSRHFKANPSLVTYAEEAVNELQRFYDGIISGNVILQFERPHNSVKVAEITLSVFNATLIARHESDDFNKSIDGAVDKMLSQLRKYKERLRHHDRKEVRRIRSKE